MFKVYIQVYVIILCAISISAYKPTWSNGAKKLVIVDLPQDDGYVSACVDMAVGDWDCDGDFDIIVANTRMELYLFRNTGNSVNYKFDQAPQKFQNAVVDHSH